MATPVFCCGGECGALGAAIGGGHYSLVGTSSISTTTVRNGARAWRANPTAATGYAQFVTPNADVMVARFAIQFASLPLLDAWVFSVDTSFFDGVAFKASDSKIYPAYDSSGIQFGSQGFSVTTGVWYVVDVLWNGTAHTIDMQVDATALTQLSNAAIADTADTPLLGSITALTTMDAFYDDFIVSNTSADYPFGDGYVNHFTLVADGAHNVATANDFEFPDGTDITNLTTTAYTQIDKVPLDVITTAPTEFINMVAPPNATDYTEHVFGPAAGISVPTTGPRAVQVVAMVAQAGTGQGNMELRLNDNGTTGVIYTATAVAGIVNGKYVGAQFADPPSAATAWNANGDGGNGDFRDLRVRFGSPGTLDVNPDQYFASMMIEAEFAAVVVVVNPEKTDDFPVPLGHHPKWRAQQIYQGFVRGTNLNLGVPATGPPLPINRGQTEDQPNPIGWHPKYRWPAVLRDGWTQDSAYYPLPGTPFAQDDWANPITVTRNRIAYEGQTDSGLALGIPFTPAVAPPFKLDDWPNPIGWAYQNRHQGYQGYTQNTQIQLGVPNCVGLTTTGVGLQHFKSPHISLMSDGARIASWVNAAGDIRYNIKPAPLANDQWNNPTGVSFTSEPVLADVIHFVDVGDDTFVLVGRAGSSAVRIYKLSYSAGVITETSVQVAAASRDIHGLVYDTVNSLLHAWVQIDNFTNTTLFAINPGDLSPAYNSTVTLPDNWVHGSLASDGGANLFMFATIDDASAPFVAYAAFAATASGIDYTVGSAETGLPALVSGNEQLHSARWDGTYFFVVISDGDGTTYQFLQRNAASSYAALVDIVDPGTSGVLNVEPAVWRLSGSDDLAVLFIEATTGSKIYYVRRVNGVWSDPAGTLLPGTTNPGSQEDVTVSLDDSDEAVPGTARIAWLSTFDSPDRIYELTVYLPAEPETDTPVINDDFPLPIRSRFHIGYQGWTQDSAYFPLPGTPFAQDDWPNPLRPSYATTYQGWTQDSTYFPLPQPLPVAHLDDFPNPILPRIPHAGYVQSRNLNLLPAPAAQDPFIPDDWQNPVRLRFHVAHHGWTQDSAYYPLPGTPFSLDDWPNPLRPSYAVTYQGWTQDSTYFPLPQPIAPREDEWPNPVRARLDHKGYVQSTDLSLLTVAAPPPDHCDDWPNPVLSRAHVAYHGWTQNGRALNVPNQPVIQISQTDWPNPIGLHSKFRFPPVIRQGWQDWATPPSTVNPGGGGDIFVAIQDEFPFYAVLLIQCIDVESLTLCWSWVTYDSTTVYTSGVRVTQVVPETMIRPTSEAGRVTQMVVEVLVHE